MLTEIPEGGWIREIRAALGMSGRQLAARMGLSQSAVSQLEQSELDGRVQLETLGRAAAALDCDLVYALVPRTSLEETVRTRARVLAGDTLGADAKHDEVELYASLLTGARLWDEREAR